MTQIKDLVEFAQAYIDGEKFEEMVDGVWVETTIGDVSIESMVEYLVEPQDIRIKPQLKKIDMSCLVGSGVLCEFADNNPNAGRIARLDHITDDGAMVDDNVTVWTHCRPLFNYWHHHDGGECPLPEGFIVEVLHRDGTESVQDTSSGHTPHWNSGRISDVDIIAYRITGIAEGWEL